MIEVNEQAATAVDKQEAVITKLRLLLDITKKISRSLDLEEVLNMVMDTLVSVLPYDAAGIYLIECDSEYEGDEPPCIFRTEIVRGYDIDDLRELRLKMGEGIIGRVAQTKEPYISYDVRKDPYYVNARKKTFSEMVAPIISNERVVGVFDLESDRLNAYNDDDLQVLMLLASQVAIIIEKVELHHQLVEKKRLEGQLEVARQVQLELLPPHDPHLRGYDMSAYNFPTEEVSGDYYDWVRIYDDQLGIVIADVSGKGIPAALIMAFLRASLRAAAHVGYAPNVSLTKVNYLLWESTEDHQYVTAFFGMLDATHHTLSYANAGHNPPLLIDENGNTRYIERGGVPLGMFEHSRYYEHYLKIKPGQTFILYTDGVTEAKNEAGEEYGRKRLTECVLKGKDLSARKMIDFIRNDMIEFSGSNGVDDDVTLFIIKALK
jgi:sigma-B regulation protein RsbU (phosphoserine phosphatase)